VLPESRAGSEHRGDSAEPNGVTIAPAGERLVSWKEVAGYFNRQVRTVQRWEQEEGLPIHRHQHKERASVYAFKSELDAWWKTHAPSEDQAAEEPEAAQAARGQRWPRRRPGLWLAAIVVVAAAMAGTALILLRRAPTTGSELTGIRLLGKSLAEGHRFRSVPLPGKPASVAISPRGNELYVVTDAPSFLTVLNTAALRVSATIPIAPAPIGIAVSPDGAQIFVGHYGGDVTVFQTKTWQSTVLAVGSPVTDIAVTPDGKRLYVAMERNGLKRVSLNTGEQKRLVVVPCPMRLALTPDGSRLYVNYQCGGPGGRPGHDTIEVFELPSERSVAVMGGFPNVGGEIRVSPDGSYLWAYSGQACTEPVYDAVGCPAKAPIMNLFRTQNSTLLRTFVTPGGIEAFFDRGNRAVLTHSNGVDVLDTISLFTRETLPLGHIWGAVISPDQQRAYVATPNNIAVFEMAHGCDPPENGLANFWPGDGNPNDVHRGYHAILRGDTRFGPGRIGQAFMFDGVGDYAEATDGWGIESGSFAVAAWVKFNSVGKPLANRGTDERPMSIVARVEPAEPHRGWRLAKTHTGHFLFCNRDESIAHCLATGKGVLSRTRAVAGKWFQVTGVQDRDSISIYVNGVLEAKRPLVLEEITAAANLSIGGNDVDSAFLDGLVDEVALYRTLVSPAQVRSVYDAGNHLDSGSKRRP